MDESDESTIAQTGPAGYRSELGFCLASRANTMPQTMKTTIKKITGERNALQRNVVTKPKTSPRNDKPNTSAKDTTGWMCLWLLLRASHSSIPHAQNIPQKAADIHSCAVSMGFPQFKQAIIIIAGTYFQATTLQSAKRD